jgi:hypothetical protein
MAEQQKRDQEQQKVCAHCVYSNPKEGRTTRHRQEAQTSFATCALDSVLSPGSSAQHVDDGRGARRAQGVTELARGPCGAACAVELVYNPTRSRPARERAQICDADGVLTVASAVSWTSKRPHRLSKSRLPAFDPPLFLPLQILHFLCTESHSLSLSCCARGQSPPCDGCVTQAEGARLHTTVNLWPHGCRGVVHAQVHPRPPGPCT